MGKIKNKNILITGGSGFIGKNLQEHLQLHYNIYAPSHKELELLNSERVRKFIIEKKIDVIIHSAIVGGSKEDFELNDIVYANLRIFFNLARNAKYVEKIFNFSSGLEYNKVRPLVNVRESDFDKKVPTDHYGFYKYVCAKYIELSKNIYDLVLFGIYGKYEDYLYKFISNAIVKNLFKLPITIVQNVYFDYIYIDDLTKIMHYLINKTLKQKRYNVTTGKKIDLLSIANIINSVSDYKSEILVLTAGLNKEYTASNKQLMGEIKGLAFTNPKTAVKELYNWYKNNLKRVNVKKIKKDNYIKFIKEKKTLYHPVPYSNL